MDPRPVGKPAPSPTIGGELDSRPASTRLTLARLLQVLMILQSERFPNARRLAEACAVSRRTIYRDLGILDSAGISVVYRPDRQGYELVRGRVLQPIPLDEKEAMGLVAVARLGHPDDPFGFVRLARVGLAKVLQALPVEVRDRVARGGELIAEEAADPVLSADRRAIYQTILDALSHRLRVRSWYAESDSSPVRTTTLSVYRLARLDGQWSLVGHSSSHRQVRVFQTKGIRRLELTVEPYTIPPRFRLERFLNKPTGAETTDD